MKFERLTKIDETNIQDHCYLEATDRCFYFGEYFSRKSYQGGPTNQLVFNFKTRPSVAEADSRRRYYKESAIGEIATGLSSVLHPRDIEHSTWVPVPTSKAKDDPDFDDRLERTLSQAFRGKDADIRPLLIQTRSTQADHENSERLTPEQLKEVLSVDHDLLRNKAIRSRVILFDDILTTGKHFKCCQELLQASGVSDMPIIGLFVARRILPNPFEEF